MVWISTSHAILIYHLITSFASTKFPRKSKGFMTRTSDQIMNVKENDSSGGSKSSSVDLKDTLHLRRLYVAGFRSTATKSEVLPTSSQLKQFFHGYGSIENIEIFGSRNYKHDDTNDDNHMNDAKDVRKRKRHIRKPFAFVTFESKTSVEQILAGATSDNDNNPDVYTMKPEVDVGIYCNAIKRCYPKKEQPIKRHRKGHEEMQNTLENSNGTNLILQLHRSHLHRMIGYIETMNNTCERRKNDDSPPVPPPKLVGSASPSSRSRVSFVFLRAEGLDAAQYWIHYFSHHPILTRFALNKVYMADTLLTIPHNIPEEEKANLLSSTALAKLSSQILSKDAKGSDVILKVQVFPPKPFQRTVIASLDAQMDALEACQASTQDGGKQLEESSLSSIPGHIQTLARDPKLGILSMSTVDYTHTLSCVQLYCPISTNNSKKSNQQAIDDRKELFMIGILPRNEDVVEPGKDDKNTDMDENNDSEICRAYFKLQEAMELYRTHEEEENKETRPLNFAGKTAFDCGSSPGGWTKYLVEREGCGKVYSCDPGKLDSSVLALDQVMHLNMRGDDAMDWIVGKESNNEKDRVHLWVSDMCLLNPSHQVDHFLRALEKGVLATNQNRENGSIQEGKWVFFVLTLKFNTGHARETFDDMAKLEVQRLKERLEAWSKIRKEKMRNDNHGDQGTKQTVNIRTYHLFSNRKGERTIMGRLFV